MLVWPQSTSWNKNIGSVSRKSTNTALLFLIDREMLQKNREQLNKKASQKGIVQESRHFDKQNVIETT